MDNFNSSGFEDEESFDEEEEFTENQSTGCVENAWILERTFEDLESPSLVLKYICGRTFPTLSRVSVNRFPWLLGLMLINYQLF